MVILVFAIGGADNISLVFVAYPPCEVRKRRTMDHRLRSLHWLCSLLNFLTDSSCSDQPPSVSCQTGMYRIKSSYGVTCKRDKGLWYSQ
ncbi:hypothetical protein Lalb_Chr24g0395301 [Lupinus albus]|uniref:Uncharacterized protein n=1 Tax=Lupinus albus TaxID=3870 RepID=A0A6A4MYG9_LUPAL|nr:hypothetical protein Lalb_Chr24g0395301 [Lupinus albus]